MSLSPHSLPHLLTPIPRRCMPPLSPRTVTHGHTGSHAPKLQTSIHHTLAFLMRPHEAPMPPMPPHEPPYSCHTSILALAHHTLPALPSAGTAVPAFVNHTCSFLPSHLCRCMCSVSKSATATASTMRPAPPSPRCAFCMCKHPLGLWG